MRGQLTITKGSVGITSPVGHPGHLVVWLVETIADASTGALRVRNPSNGSDVGVGDMAELSGGESGVWAVDALAEALPAARTSPYWIAGASWAATSGMSR